MADDQDRRFLRRLFGEKPEPRAEPPDPTNGNHVPSEGNNPTPPDSGDDLREFARQLFDRD